MTTRESFSEFLTNIKVDNSKKISDRYKEITKKLNKTFRDTESEIDNCLQVGSYGRYTGIKGISDLDMLYIMPANKWTEYKDYPGKLLRKVRDVLKERYPNTTIKMDRLVVDVFFCDFTFEVQPVFEEIDNGEINYKYPDTKSGIYKITKPRQEQEAMTDFRRNHGDGHRHLCKMIRSWKNTVGLGIGGLLIDTLTYKFLSNHAEYDFIGLSSYDELCRDFFQYLKDEPQKDYYKALGSGQNVKVKHYFQNKAEFAYNKAVQAINETNESAKNEIWREMFGRKFPKSEKNMLKNEVSSSTYTDHEEFIEDKYRVSIRYKLSLDCIISRNGFREVSLRTLLNSNKKISRIRSLDFTFTTDTPEPYEVKWKARNVGTEAIKRNCLRDRKSVV